MRRGNWRFVAEKTTVEPASRVQFAVGYALTPRLCYGNAFLLLRLRFKGGGGTNGDTRFPKRTKFGGFNRFYSPIRLGIQSLSPRRPDQRKLTVEEPMYVDCQGQN
jgi:hypothetical protein